MPRRAASQEQGKLCGAAGGEEPRVIEIHSKDDLPLEGTSRSVLLCSSLASHSLTLVTPQTLLFPPLLLTTMLSNNT